MRETPLYALWFMLTHTQTDTHTQTHTQLFGHSGSKAKAHTGGRNSPGLMTGNTEVPGKVI